VAVRAQASNRLAAMRRNPAADWKVEDVAGVCRDYGIQCVAPSRGSHYRIAHAAMDSILTITARRPVKPVYIRLLVDYIDRLEAASSHG
jgi:hypothetical protein